MHINGVLVELRIAENTAVISTSDNGFNIGHHGIWHEGNGRRIPIDNKGSRPNMYGNSLRVLALIRWPGNFKPGSTLEQTITNLDWFPTILAMARLEAPEGATLRGRSFLPLLRGNSQEWNNELFAQYSMRGADGACMADRPNGEWEYLEIPFCREFLGFARISWGTHSQGRIGSARRPLRHS